jgi:hypothetical protein
MPKKSKDSRKMKRLASMDAGKIFDDAFTTSKAEVFTPKPTQEPIDQAEIRRQLMKRFPKTLAELAK